jgi:diguanylate cyclase (GGDEF)-like protein
VEAADKLLNAAVPGPADVAYLAYHDALTGLPNRTLLGERIDAAIAGARVAGRAVALLYVDLNDFKLVNDSLGHAAGDDLLRRVAKRLGCVVREGDMLARQGGDEFLLLLADIQPDRALAAAERVAQRIDALLEEPFAIGEAVFQIGASVGTSVFPSLACDAESLQKQADAAMYRAKRAGGGHAVYEATPADPLARLSLAARMRRALEREEFELHYQPVFSLKGEPQIRGIEALIRWNDPVRGLVSPAEFIPVAEHTGVIDSIGEWVMEEVLRQGREWIDGGLSPALGFNVSPRQLRGPRFHERLMDAIARHSIEPGRVVVELTESAWMGDDGRALPVLHALRESGLQLALDDFGAGYSSLARLRALPVDIIKIDRGFLEGIPGDPEACGVVAAILQLATACRCDVVAEGIETAEQLEFMGRHGAQLGQGFHLARPAPVAEFTPLLRERLIPERQRPTQLMG